MDRKDIGRMLTVAAAASWGTSFPIVLWGLTFLDPFTFVNLRFIVASLAFLLFVIIRRKKYLSIFRNTLRNKIILIMGVMNGVAFLLQFIGQSLTTATKAALLINSNVIFVAIFSTYLLSEKFSLPKGFGVLSAFLGISLIITNGSFETLQQGTFLGDLICFSAGIIWTFYIILNKKFAISGYDSIVFMAVMMIYTSITLQVIYLGIMLFGMATTISFSVEAVVAVLYTGLINTVLAFLLWYEGLKYIEATTSSVYLLIEILVAAIISIIFLGEIITFYIALGGILLGIGIYLVER
ncbi:MAG: DMT family transporter [Candidatus Asgardarchaeia archaeon]